MARGKKARPFTHMICPTISGSDIARKKKVPAEVRHVDNLDEVLFTGKSRHECFKWMNDQATENSYVKPLFLKKSYIEFVAAGDSIHSLTPALPAAQIDDEDDGGVPADIAGDFDNLSNIADLLGE